MRCTVYLGGLSMSVVLFSTFVVGFILMDAAVVRIFSKFLVHSFEFFAGKRYFSNGRISPQTVAFP